MSTLLLYGRRMSQSKAGTNVRGRASRARLLNAALRQFGARGFRGTTLADLAADAGVSEPAVLYHFGSKEHLLEQVLHDDDMAQRERIDRDRADASLAAAVTELAARHEAAPAFIRLYTVVAAESIDPEHPAHAYFVERYRRSRGDFADWIANEQREGRLSESIDPDILARLLVAILDGLELQYLLEPGAGDIARPLAEFFNFVGTSTRAGSSNSAPLG